MLQHGDSVLRQFVAVVQRCNNVTLLKSHASEKCDFSTQCSNNYLIRLLKILLFSSHPHWAAEHATVSKNLNPRVGSMIVLSLISNVLLVEEAAAEENPGTFFQRESQGRFSWNWHQTWSGQANNRFRNTKMSVSFTHMRQKYSLQSNRSELTFIHKKMSPF